jgi:hypothetical protein
MKANAACVGLVEVYPIFGDDDAPAHLGVRRLAAAFAK